MSYDPLPTEEPLSSIEPHNGKVSLKSLKAKKEGAHKLQQFVPYKPTHTEPFVDNQGDHIIVDSYYTLLNFTYFN